ncbi:MAG: GNAT family N-acetyltransferase [Proteobacteria bacterium]|nr:GNAT family N-acetyltransferase [Pseudomonadota bacterium]MBU1386645.1 GNAT family N-acetyltransferase [Pseudomonadota bacterium]MBU1543256.1 GNAT family N-acetyltransferase [Pseudomonadota bacterium]
MSTLNLHRMFNPVSIAVIGASERKGSVGFTIMNNLLKNGFGGTIFPVNPNHKQIMGCKSVSDIKHIGAGFDLAIIATPMHTVPEIVESCGMAGAAGAVIVSSGGREIGEKGRVIESQILAIAGKYNLRILGPNCLGFANTSKALNASFAHVFPLTGKIAFLSQSGAVCTSVLDLAIRGKIGLSHFVSLGSMMDVDFADMIDYLGSMSSVQSIVIYMESITRIRKFMSAARAVSMVKPIIALKSGRSKAGALAAASHTGALAGEDAFYDAAFHRAGILRVNDFEELLECAGFLAKIGQPKGSGLVVITNAGGPGVMAADALDSHGLEPAVLSPETIEKLDKILPENWSRSNPVDVLGSTPPETYVEVVKICAQAPETDALLLLCSPVGTMDTVGLADSLCACLPELSCPAFTAWIGGGDIDLARDVFIQAGVATYDSAERAVRAFKNLYSYGQQIQTLMEIPVRTDQKLLIDRSTARKIIDSRMAEENWNLSEIDAKNLVSAYGIPVNDTRLADSPESAVQLADQMGYPVVLKICSQQILHKSDCNGVMLDLKTADAVSRAFEQIRQNAVQFNPDARIDGVCVQPYCGSADFELIIGAKKDPDFGPVLVFGSGGVMTEISRDISMGLPPLNRPLARQMIENTKISRALNGFRHFKPVSLSFIEELLIRIGRLVTDFPQISELDINPLMVKNGVLTAVDVRVVLKKSKKLSPNHLIISSYPWQYETTARTTDGHEFFIRPIRPSDAGMLVDHFNSLSPRSIYLRFFSPVKKLSNAMLVKLTQVDYDRHIALVALMGPAGDKKMVGVCRIIVDPDETLGEFALAISDEWQGHGIGSALLKQCLKAAREKGIKKIVGSVLAENTQMLLLGTKLGFSRKRLSGQGEYELNINFEEITQDQWKALEN